MSVTVIHVVHCTIYLFEVPIRLSGLHVPCYCAHCASTDDELAL